VESLILPPWLLEEEFALVASADYQERKKALSATIAQVEVRDREFMRRRAVLAASLSE